MNTKDPVGDFITKISEAVIELSKRVADIETRLASSVSLVALDKEHDRVIERMKSISATYSQHQSWSESDRTKYQELKTRRDELKRILGIKY